MGHFFGQKVAPLVVGFYYSWNYFFTREYTKCTAGSTFCFVVVVVLGKPLIKLAGISADS
jgi:hypothetical protein